MAHKSGSSSRAERARESDEAGRGAASAARVARGSWRRGAWPALPGDGARNALVAERGSRCATGERVAAWRQRGDGYSRKGARRAVGGAVDVRATWRSQHGWFVCGASVGLCVCAQGARASLWGPVAWRGAALSRLTLSVCVLRARGSDRPSTGRAPPPDLRRRVTWSRGGVVLVPPNGPLLWLHARGSPIWDGWVPGGAAAEFRSC